MASWAEQNLGRFRNAQGSLAAGSDAMLKGLGMLQTTGRDLTQVGFGAWQNRLQRQHEKALPNIKAKAKVNEAMWLANAIAEAQGLKKKKEEGVIPEEKTQPLSTSDAYRQFMYENRITPTDYEKIMPQEETDMYRPPATEGAKTIADGTKFPNEYAEAVTGNKKDWPKLKFYENGVEIPYTKAWDPKTKKVRPGVEVDYSALTEGEPSSALSPESAISPEALKLPSHVRLPQPERIPQEAVMAQTEPEDTREYGKGMPEDWYQQSSMLAVEPEIKQKRESSRERVIEDMLGGSAEKKWSRWMQGVHGWAPIDYSSGGREREDKEREEEGTLTKHIRKYMANFLQTPAGKQLFTLDMEKGGYVLNPNVNPDEALAKAAFYVAQRGETGQNLFRKYTDRADWAGMMDAIAKANPGTDKDRAINEWMSKVILPNLKKEMSDQGFISAEKETGNRFTPGSFLGLTGARSFEEKARFKKYERSIGKLQTLEKNIEKLSPQEAVLAENTLNSLAASAATSSLGQWSTTVDILKRRGWPEHIIKMAEKKTGRKGYAYIELEERLALVDYLLKKIGTPKSMDMGDVRGRYNPE